MNWSEERWVKHYTRRTVEWIMTSFDARGVYNELIAMVDQAGYLTLGEDGVPGLAYALNIPAERCQAAIDELVARKWIALVGTKLLIPSHYEAQSATTSGRVRQAEYRERKQAESAPPRDVSSQNVTGGDEALRAVTASDDKRDRKERKKREKDLPSADARELAAYLHSAILAHTPDFSASTRAWPAQAEKALRQGLAISRLRAAIDFVHGGGRGDWWRPYILSVGALVKKLPTLEMQARQTPPGQRRQVTIEESGLRDAGEYLASLRVVGDE